MPGTLQDHTRQPFFSSTLTGSKTTVRPCPAQCASDQPPGFQLFLLAAQVFGGAVAAFAPGSFMQVNYDMMGAALAAIQSFVPHGSRVCLQGPLMALLNMCTSSCLAHKL
jgi:hypothetical protein